MHAVCHAWHYMTISTLDNVREEKINMIQPHPLSFESDQLTNHQLLFKWLLNWEKQGRNDARMSTIKQALINFLGPLAGQGDFLYSDLCIFELLKIIQNSF